MKSDGFSENLTQFYPKSLYFVANFDDFLQNNMQKNYILKNYQPLKKFMFWQLVAIFFDFWWNNIIFVQKKGGGDFKIWTSRKAYILTVSLEFCDFQQNNSIFMQNNRPFKKYHSWGKIIFCQLAAKNRKFCQFLMKFIFGKNKILHLKISAWRNVHISIINHKSCQFSDK